jgi:hypothetical protein
MFGPRGPRFTVRVLNAAETDPAYRNLRHADLQMLLAFAERFDALGWLPRSTKKNAGFSRLTML